MLKNSVSVAVFAAVSVIALSVPALILFAASDAIFADRITPSAMFAEFAMISFAPMVVAVTAPALFAVGVNCTAPPLVTPLLASARPVTDLPFVVYPNHGRAWDAEHECWVGDGDDRLVERVGEWVALGAGFIGGCCGVGPDGVAHLVAARAAL